MKRIVVIAALALLGGARAASAETFVMWLDVCVPDTAPCNPLAGNVVQLKLEGGVADVVVFSRSAGQNSFGFNLAGSTAGLNVDIHTPGVTLGTSDQIGPFGSFEYVFDRADHTPFSSPPFLGFTLTRDAGFLTPSDVFEMNELGWLAASHWYYFTNGANFSAGNTIELAPAPIPEPASMLLLGTGLLGAWRVRRR